jgi:hypothetical protein
MFIDSAIPRARVVALDSGPCANMAPSIAARRVSGPATPTPGATRSPLPVRSSRPRNALDRDLALVASVDALLPSLRAREMPIRAAVVVDQQRVPSSPAMLQRERCAKPLARERDRQARTEHERQRRECMEHERAQPEWMKTISK